MTAFESAIWKTGTKDNKVYVELWNCDDTMKLIDAELPPDAAYNIGQALIAHAIRQGHNPPNPSGETPHE